MSLHCPYCHIKSQSHPKSSPYPRKLGFYYRKSDRRRIQRFLCLKCKRSFSKETFKPFYRHRIRNCHETLSALLTSTVSQRACSRILRLNRKTVVRKFIILGQVAGYQLQELNHFQGPALSIQFDDMETFEHTKCKPLSITLAVEERTRRILGFQVSSMPAKGHLAAIARKKYGLRKDERAQARNQLFKSLKSFTKSPISIKSDMNPHYEASVKSHFPEALYTQFKGRRGCVVGQGELKRGGYDPLFSLNHTCAKLRADTNRLLRRTWCTTKKPERLALHLNMIALNHNLGLLKKKHN